MIDSGDKQKRHIYPIRVYLQLPPLAGTLVRVYHFCFVMTFTQYMQGLLSQMLPNWIY